MSHQRLGEAYANVRDFGALGDGGTDDTEAIQDAIDACRRPTEDDPYPPKHVLFPAGNSNPDVPGTFFEYVIEGELKFHNDVVYDYDRAHPPSAQRIEFLSGASLGLARDEARITITGQRQTFTNLRIIRMNKNPEGGYIYLKRGVLIDGAHGLLIRDLEVNLDMGNILIKIVNTVGVTIECGQIRAQKNPGSVGLLLGDGVKDFHAVGLAIHQLDRGVVLRGTTHNISFEAGTIEAELQNMVDVEGKVHGFSLIGTHMESGTSGTNTAGARQFIVVQEGGGVYGGAISGCILGSLVPQPGKPASNFRIAGDWIGVCVFGCVSLGALNRAVYDVAATAKVEQSGDMFNDWDSATIGVGVGPPPILQAAANAPANGALGPGMTMTANGIRIYAEKVR